MILVFIIIIGIFSLIGATGTALFGPRAMARKRLRQASRELVDGSVVTLTGTVIARSKVLEAPLSGRDGVAFASAARIYGGDRRHRRRPVVAEVNEIMMVEFELETKSGKVVVEDSDVIIEFPPEPLIPRKIDREQRFLVAHGRGDIHAGDAGFDEIVITPGMKVSVHGAVRIEAAPGEATYRETGKKIVIAPPPGHPLTIGRPV